MLDFQIRTLVEGLASWDHSINPRWALPDYFPGYISDSNSKA
jgi:hypothetical protein